MKKKKVDLADVAHTHGMRVEDIIKAAKEEGIKGVKVSPDQASAILRKLQEDLYSVLGGDEKIKDKLQKNQLIFKVVLPEQNIEYYTLYSEAEAVELEEGQKRDVITLDQLIEIAPYIPRIAKASKKAAASAATTKATPTTETEAMPKEGEIVGYDVVFDVESASAPESEAIAAKEQEAQAAVPTIEPKTKVIKDAKKKQVFIDPALFEHICENLYPYSYLLYDESVGRQYEAPIPKKKLKELLGEDKVNRIDKFGLKITAMLPIGLFSIAARKKGQRRNEKARNYLIDNKDSFMYNFPREFKDMSDAPDVYTWIERNKNPEDKVDGKTLDIPFYVQVIKELREFREREGIEVVHRYWLQVANAVEAVKREQWIKDEILSKDLDASEVLVKLVRRIHDNPKDYDAKNLDLFLKGLYGIKRLRVRKGNSFAAVHLDKDFIGAGNYLLKKKDMIERIVMTAYERIKDDIPSYDLSNMADVMRLRRKIEDVLTEEEKSQFLPLGTSRLSPDIDEPVSVRYRADIIKFYIGAFPEKFQKN